MKQKSCTKHVFRFYSFIFFSFSSSIVCWQCISLYSKAAVVLFLFFSLHFLFHLFVALHFLVFGLWIISQFLVTFVSLFLQFCWCCSYFSLHFTIMVAVCLLEIPFEYLFFPFAAMEITRKWYEWCAIDHLYAFEMNLFSCHFAYIYMFVRIIIDSVVLIHQHSTLYSIQFLYLLYLMMCIWAHENAPLSTILIILNRFII